MYAGRRPEYYDDYIPNEHNFTTISDDDDVTKSARNSVQSYMQSQTNIRERCRAYEKLTFLRLLYQFHNSIIVSTVNLGFEELDHRSVIHGMLLSIRNQYHDNFTSLRSPRVIVRHVFGLLFAMIIVSDLSEELFEIRKINSSGESSKNTWLKYTLPQNSPKEADDLASQKENLLLHIVKSSEGDYDAEDDIYRKNSLNKFCGIKLSRMIKKSANGKVEYFESPKISKLLCGFGGWYANKILPLLYFELININVGKFDIPEGEILRIIFDVHDKPYYEMWDSLGECNKENKFSGNKSDDSTKSLCIYDKGYNETTDTESMNLCVYHIILFVIAFNLFRRLNKIFCFIPYYVILAEIDKLMEALTATTTTKKNRGNSVIDKMGAFISGELRENEKDIMQNMLDPRVVELSFMEILEKICYSRSLYFQPLYSKERSPSAEITFVFDELDKLASDANSQATKGNQDGNDSELHRLNLMKGLLSNIKRIITSSAARYIFIGGRLLHDEWLADGARRQPLLTSIFSDEIYLPSLLSDISISWFQKSSNTLLPIPVNYPLHARIEELFVLQYYLARGRFTTWATQIWSPAIGLGSRNSVVS